MQCHWWSVSPRRIHAIASCNGTCRSHILPLHPCAERQLSGGQQCQAGQHTHTDASPQRASTELRFERCACVQTSCVQSSPLQRLTEALLGGGVADTAAPQFQPEDAALSAR